MFKVGDKVFDIQYGWGQVTGIFISLDYPVFVEFNGASQSYTSDGKFYKKSQQAVLSFTEYKLEGFSQERPKPKLPFKVGDVVYLSDGDVWITEKLMVIVDNKAKYPFMAFSHNQYSDLATENPLKNPDTKIWTAEDLKDYEQQ